MTRQFARAIEGTKAKIADTRKTTPGLRMLEKYAVLLGGGVNHRSGLDDGIFIKANHASLVGGIGRDDSPLRAQLRAQGVATVDPRVGDDPEISVFGERA